MLVVVCSLLSIVYIIMRWEVTPGLLWLPVSLPPDLCSLCWPPSSSLLLPPTTRSQTSSLEIVSHSPAVPVLASFLPHGADLVVSVVLRAGGWWCGLMSPLPAWPPASVMRADSDDSNNTQWPAATSDKADLLQPQPQWQCQHNDCLETLSFSSSQQFLNFLSLLQKLEKIPIETIRKLNPIGTFLPCQRWDNRIEKFRLEWSGTVSDCALVVGCWSPSPSLTWY